MGDEDELEEDVEQSLSCLESVLEVDRSDPEDELVDKPGSSVCARHLIHVSCA